MIKAPMIKRTKAISEKLAALVLSTALVLGSFVALPDKAYAASSGDIATGDFVKIGNEDVAGYTGTPLWRVLDKKDDGSMLLMSEYLWRGDGTDDANAGVCFNSITGSGGQTKDINGQVFHWRGTAAETWCDSFWDAILKDVEGLTVKPVTVTDQGYTYTQTKYSGSNNKTIIFAEADTILYQNKVFFLSAEELAGYEDSPGYIVDPEQRTAHMPDSETAVQWLLRSTQNDTNWASEVKPDGEIAAVSANTRRAARPAFWAEFADETSFVSSVDESGRKIWTIGEDRSAVNNVEALINSLPAKGSVKTSDKAAIEAARAAYDALTDEQKASLDPGILGRLTDAEKDLTAALKAEAEKKAADAKAAAEAKVKKVRTVTVNTATVNAKAIAKAVKKAGGSSKYVTKIVLGKKVKKISPKAFAKYKKVTTLEVKTKKLKKKTVKKSLKGSKVKTIKVKVSKKAKTNKKYVKNYKKIFTKKNAGRKVSVKR